MATELEAALASALGALRRRERTVAELRSWLLDRGLGEATVEAVISGLIGLGELDDERFAHAFAADKRALAGWGSERIRAALGERGVERGLCERAAAEEREAELERATGLLAARGAPVDDDRARGRALALLTRRGYEYELAYEAVRAHEAEASRGA